MKKALAVGTLLSAFLVCNSIVFAQHNPIPQGALPVKIIFIIWMFLHDFVFRWAGSPLATIFSAITIASPILITVGIIFARLWKRKTDQPPLT